MFRRGFSVLCGSALLAVCALSVPPQEEIRADAVAARAEAGADANAVAAAAGATTPFVTLEAEAGQRGGGATVRSIGPGATAPTKATLETEASGYALVELKSNGDSVTLPNSTGKNANTLVVRASIPDAPGGGITATLNLYVNNVFRQAITLDSRQAWNYRGATTNPDDPNAGGQAYRFYNEFPVWVTGAPSPPAAPSNSRRTQATRRPFTTSLPWIWRMSLPR